MTRLLCTLFVLLFSFALRAEPPRQPPGPPPFEELAAALHLTDAQRSPVKAIMDAQHEQMRTLRQATHEEREAVHQATNAKLANLLSDEQMQLLQQFRETHRPPPPPQGDEDRGPPPPGSL